VSSRAPFFSFALTCLQASSNHSAHPPRCVGSVWFGILFFHFVLVILLVMAMSLVIFDTSLMHVSTILSSSSGAQSAPSCSKKKMNIVAARSTRVARDERDYMLLGIF